MGRLRGLRGRRRAAATAALTAGTLGAGWIAGRPDDPEYYRSLKQAPYAPPAWAFGPAWTVARTGTSWAIVRAATEGRGSPAARRVLAGLAALDGLVYTTFSYVYFRRRSIKLAAVWTVADAATTGAGLALLARQDRVAARGLLPQAAWLCLATPVALYQARHNPSR